VRNPNTRSAYRVAWRAFLAFCSARQLELASVKAYQGHGWISIRGVVEYNPDARARPPRLVRESSLTPVFEEAEIVALLDSINLESLKDVRDKAIFSVLFIPGAGCLP
jgi:site-specific recombinase XerD